MRQVEITPEAPSPPKQSLPTPTTPPITNPSEPSESSKNPIAQPKKLLPPISTPKRSPLLLKTEKDKIMDYGQSLDSKKVDETIGIIDIENI